MTLQQLLYFKTVSETGSYTIAAQTLRVSQSVVSYGIAELEKELNVSLFDRGRGKKIFLTEAGRRYLHHVGRIFSALTDARGELDRLKSDFSAEKVTIAYSYFTAASILSEIIRSADFAEYPGNIEVSPLLCRSGAETYAKALLSDEADLAITALPPEKKLDGTRIAAQELVLLVNRKNPLARRGSVCVEELKDEPLIGCSEPDSSYTKAVVSMFEKHGYTPSFFTTYPADGNWFEQLSRVALGQGSAIVPRMAAGARDSSTVAVVTLEDPGAFCPVYLLWVKDHPLSAAAEFTKETIVKYAKETVLLDSL